MSPLDMSWWIGTVLLNDIISGQYGVEIFFIAKIGLKYFFDLTEFKDPNQDIFLFIVNRKTDFCEVQNFQDVLVLKIKILTTSLKCNFENLL